MKKNLPTPKEKHPLMVIRENAGLEQHEFGALFGVSQSTISLVESGKRSLSLSLAEKISDHYKIKLDALLGNGNLPSLSKLTLGSTLLKELPLLSTKANHTEINKYLKDEYELESVCVLDDPRESYAHSVIIESGGIRYIADIISQEEDYKYITGLVAIIYPSRLIVRRIKNNDLVTDQKLTLHNDSNNDGMFTLAASDIKRMYKLKKIVWADVE